MKYLFAGTMITVMTIPFAYGLTFLIMKAVIYVFGGDASDYPGDDLPTVLYGFHWFAAFMMVRPIAWRFILRMGHRP